MFLQGMAERWIGDSLDVYDQATGVFSPAAMKGRIAPVTSAASESNKSFRRRMLHFAIGSTIPDSRVIRHPASGDVYLVGQQIGNSLEDREYTMEAVCHLVRDEGQYGSSGLVQVNRQVPPGPPENPGWLIDSVVDNYYADITFRDSPNEPDLNQYKRETFFLHLPSNADVQKYDFVELHNHIYRITDTHFDTGFLMAGLIQEPDYRVDLVVEVGTEKQYDQALMRYVEVKVEHNVTMFLDSVQDFGSWSSDASDYMDLSVMEGHIGFRPVAGMVVKHEGRSRTVHHVQFFRGERQYKLRCK